MVPHFNLLPLVQQCTTLTPHTPDALAEHADTSIQLITSDSRAAKAGSIFVALVGTHTDGHQYIEQAINNGASAIVARRDKVRQMEAKGFHFPANLPVLVTSNTYKSLADLCSTLYGHPGKQMKLIGVTGTNGKTTVTHLLETILKKQKKSVGLIGTLGVKAASSTEKSAYESTGHTTPMAPELQALLYEMYQKQTEYVVMEVSSHALEQNRSYGCDFQVAVLTNITQDHLDYHKTMENYWRSKALLFQDLAHSNTAVINLDSDYANEFVNCCQSGVTCYTYSLQNNKASVYTTDIQYSITGATFTVVTPVGSQPVHLKLAGQFSIYNALAAITTGIALGISLADCVQAIETVAGIPGRFEVVSEKPFVIVDYAHTPDGLENILNAARVVTPEGGKLICVFGCGGDRDATKRPKMGRVVEQLADQMVITSDNPRSEDPQQIITDIISGIQRFDAQRMLVNPDREQAIAQAIKMAAPNDIIVVAGKGHEDYQILADKTIHFDDKEVVQKYVGQNLANTVSA